jgi:hypothetical protein
MRDELIRIIQEKTGLDESMAGQVADVAIEYVKSKLPAELHPIIDSGASAESGSLGGILGGLGGLLGGRS